MASTVTNSLKSTAKDMPDDDFMCLYGGRWLTWEQFRRARLDALLPPQPRREWRCSAPKSDGPNKHAEYRRQLLDARHQ